MNLIRCNGRCLIKSPEFDERSQLTRYVHESEKLRSGRIGTGVFAPNPGDKYLSVNSLEIDSIPQIADYYRSTFKCKSKVNMVNKRVHEFLEAAEKASLPIFVSEDGLCEFDGPRGRSPAFKHRPTKLSQSHCGVEFISEEIDPMIVKKIARRLRGSRPHSIQV